MTKGDKGLTFYPCFKAEPDNIAENSSILWNIISRWKCIHFNMGSKPWFMGKSGLLLVSINKILLKNSFIHYTLLAGSLVPHCSTKHCNVLWPADIIWPFTGKTCWARGNLTLGPPPLLSTDHEATVGAEARVWEESLESWLYWASIEKLQSNITRCCIVFTSQESPCFISGPSGTEDKFCRK